MQNQINNKKQIHNYAYIDGANLYKSIEDLGWRLDYVRFRVWLKERYHIHTAYLFIGLIPARKDLYKYLQEAGFILVYKEVVFDKNGKAKGNCDADLVLQVTRDAYDKKFDKALIVSSDGDYASLAKFLIEKEKLEAILSPASKDRCSILLKRTDAPIAYIADQEQMLKSHIKEKAPGGDGTPQGSFS